MNLHTYLSTKESATVFAKRISVPFASLSNWRHGKRNIPINMAVLIEKETDGLVTRKEMRPKDWMKIWPELKKNSNEKAA